MIPYRILIVEDEAILAGDLGDQLGDLGYAVVGTTDSAPDAVRLAGELNPDLVFMDIRLRGGGDGIGAAEEIRRVHRVPVVFLTAHSDADTLDRAKSTGPFGYVHKPWDARALRTAVELALTNHRSACLLRESEERHRATLNGIGDGIIAVDAGGCVTLLNPAAERLTGWSQADAAGRPFDQVFPLVNEADGAPAFNPLERAWRDGIPAGIETGTALVRRDGTRLPIDDTANPIGERAGAPGPAVVAFRDVTERRKAEAALRDKQKLESVGLLAGGLAHDFNNLLTPILGYAHLLGERLAGDPEAAEMLGQIATAAGHAAHLTRQMLAYAGKGRFEIGPVDLSALVRDMAALLTAAVSRKAAIGLELAPAVPAVEADAAQLRQVVMNLITNAADALGGAGSIRVRTRSARAGVGELESRFVDPAPAPGEYVVLEVEDTGCGMDEGTLARIFDPFFTTKFVGRGLGLSAVLGIVTGHKGTVKVATAVGRGTRFEVYFPASSLKPEAPARAPLASAPVAGTVLLADDDPLVRRFTETTLQRAGLQVIAVADGRAAVEAFRARRAEIDLVVLDQTMPELSGIEALAEMRTTHPDLRAVLMSGYTPQDIADGFPNARLSAFVQKPCHPAHLVAVVREVLSQRHAPE